MSDVMSEQRKVLGQSNDIKVKGARQVSAALVFGVVAAAAGSTALIPSLPASLVLDCL